MDLLDLLVIDCFLSGHAFLALTRQATAQKSNTFSLVNTCVQSQAEPSLMQPSSSSEAKPQVILLPLPFLLH